MASLNVARSKSSLAFAIGSAVLLLSCIALVLLQAKIILWLIAFFCFFVFVTALTRGRLQNAVLTLASLAFVLCVLEGVGLYAEPKVVYDHGAGLVSPRPVVGWGPAHAGAYHDRKTVDGRVSFDVTYTVDANLFRSIDAGQTGPAISFLGDSFVFGTGLNDPETLPQQFANLEGRKLPVYSLGIAGYSPAQVLVTMQTGISDALLKKSELLVEFMAPWHAERTACKVDWVRNAPRYAVVDGTLRRDGVCPTYRPDVLQKSHFYKTFVMPRLNGNDDADLARLVAVAKETIRLAHDKYGLPIIVYYLSDPTPFRGTSWSNARIMKDLENAGAKVLSYNIPDEYKAPYLIIGDTHPTGLANSIHAARLATYIEKTFPDLAASKALGQKRAEVAAP